MKRYVLAEVDPITNARLTRYAEKLGLDVTESYNGGRYMRGDFKFHCTVMATETWGRGLELGKAFSVPPFQLQPVRTMVIGDRRIPCLELALTAPLQQLHVECQVAYGMRHMHESFLPHLSLSYGTDGLETFEAELPQFPITAATIRVTGNSESAQIESYYQRAMRWHRRNDL